MLGREFIKTLIGVKVKLVLWLVSSPDWRHLCQNRRFEERRPQCGHTTLALH